MEMNRSVSQSSNVGTLRNNHASPSSSSLHALSRSNETTATPVKGSLLSRPPHVVNGVPNSSTPTKTSSSPSAAVRSVFANTSSNVPTNSHMTIVQIMDGLPVLSSHSDSVEVDPCVHEHVGVVDWYGEISTRGELRRAFLSFYGSTGQLPVPTTGNDSDPSKSSTLITESTLRMDVELELLRRQCFAERNARWMYHTPESYAYIPPLDTKWVPTPYLGLRKKKQLLRKRQEYQHHDMNGDTTSMYHDTMPTISSSAGEYVRDRPWPPKEFSFKPNIKPARGGNRTSAKKKAVINMSIDTPTLARVCHECWTQSSPMWRKRPRPVAVSTANVIVPPGVVPPIIEEDVCLRCFYVTQRQDVFEKLKNDKIKKKKEEAARAIAEAKQWKKEQQQLKKKIRKLTRQQDDEVDKIIEEEDIKEEENEEEVENEEMERGVPKKSRKKSSRKEKKKKKKSKKKHAENESGEDDMTTNENHEDDDEEETESVVFPSPPQRQMNGFVYADRVSQVEEFELEKPVVEEDPLTGNESSGSDYDTGKKRSRSSKTSSRSSSKKRSRSNGEARTSRSSKKNKADGDSSKTTKSPKANTIITVKKEAMTAAVAASTVRTPPSRKSTSTINAKRERELRALGQYCPACNETYEEDDPSSFVCCDSCELWVHSACDSTLTPTKMAALAETNEKYICPMCSGR